MGIANSHLAAAFRKSGKTQETFCSEQGIALHKLRYYLYKKAEPKHLKSAMSRMAVPVSSALSSLPVEFVSFNHRSPQRQPMTIISGHFSIAEIIELLAKAGVPVC